MFTSPFQPKEKVPRIKALMAYFGAERKLTVDEIKALPDDDRIELARAVGQEWDIDVMC